MDGFLVTALATGPIRSPREHSPSDAIPTLPAWGLPNCYLTRGTVWPWTSPCPFWASVLSATRASLGTLAQILETSPSKS